MSNEIIDVTPEPQESPSATASDPARVTAIARAAYEINQAYCSGIGDTLAPNWMDTDKAVRIGVEAGVREHLENPDITPEESHANWVKSKEADGWKYGPVKDMDKKEHPCMVPYSELPKSQQAKDYIFAGVIRVLTVLV